MNRESQKLVPTRNFSHLEPQKFVPANHKKSPIRKIKLMLHGMLFGSRGPSEFISATPNALTEKGSGDYFPHRFLYLMRKETTQFGIICYSYITALKQNTHNQPK